MNVQVYTLELIEPQNHTSTGKSYLLAKEHEYRGYYLRLFEMNEEFLFLVVFSSNKIRKIRQVGLPIIQRIPRYQVVT